MFSEPEESKIYSIQYLQNACVILDSFEFGFFNFSDLFISTVNNQLYKLKFSIKMFKFEYLHSLNWNHKKI